MSGIDGVLAVVVPTALGSSVVSTLITTYATQTRERRQARAEVRGTIRVTEQAAHAADTSYDRMRETLDEFVRAAQLACLPMHLVDLYFAVTHMLWGAVHLSPDEWPGPTPQGPARETAEKVSAEAFRLLVSATWRPHRARVQVWRGTRRYRRILVAGIPETDRRFARSRLRSREWEREMLRRERRDRRARRQANLPGRRPDKADKAGP